MLRLVSELLDSNENQEEISRINQSIITQEKMKAKLLEHNSNGNITNKDFVKMTNQE